MKMKRIMAAVLSLIILVFTLCSCDKKIYITTGLKDDEIFKLSGNPCKLSEMMLILMNEKNRYEKDFGSDIWSHKSGESDKSFEDEIKSKVKNQLSELKTIELLAKIENIKLSEDEKNTLDMAAAEYFLSLSEDDKKLLNVSKSDILSLYTSFYMADRVYEKLTSEISVEISDEEARVVQCKYIIISTVNVDQYGNKTPMTEEDKKAAKDKATSAYDKLSQGIDFNVVAKEYSDNNEIDVYLTRDSIYDSVEEAVYQMKAGDISDVIETEDGYYIFFCVSDYLEQQTIENKLFMKEKYKKDEYEKVYRPFQREQTLEFNDKIWDKINIKDYVKVTTTTLYDVYNKWVAPAGN